MHALDLARFAVDVSLKATALLVLASAALLALRRASAATRHLVAVAGLLGALTIPPLAAVLPRWELPVLPAAVQAIGRAGEPAEDIDARDRWAPADATGPSTLRRIRPGAVAIGRTLLLAWVGLAWAAVAALALSRLGVGMARVHSSLRRSTPLLGERWSTPFVQASRALGLSRFVRLAVSDDVEVAMTAGETVPFVLLPSASTGWPAERRRIVLLHELAHVKRHDWLTQLACEASLGLFWFNPLAWWTARNVRRDAEQAADDLVLCSGERPSVYAHHLLEIMRSLRPGREPALPAMAMARKSGFERRLRALLDGRRHGPASFSGRAAAFALCAAALAVATVRPTRAQSDAQAPCSSGASAASIDSHAVLQDPNPRVQYAWSQSAKHDRATAYSHGMELHTAGRYSEAIAAFEKAIEHGEREGAASYNIACAHARLGHKDRAFEWLDKAFAAGFAPDARIEEDGDLSSLHGDHRFDAVARRAREERLAGPKAQAGRLASRFDALLARAPEAPEGWFAMGNELLRAGEYDRAARAFKEAAARSRKPAPSLYNAACALARGGRISQAFAHLQLALESGFDDPRLVRTDKDLENLRGDSRFRDLQQMADDLAMTSAGTGGWRAAAERYETYGRSHPTLGRAFFNAGLARLFANEPGAAVPSFTRALELRYRSASTLYNLACAEALLDHRDRAFALLAQAIDQGFEASAHLRGDRDLDNLRGDARFGDTLRRAVELERSRAEG
jgi:beta-lactamase regulating signal transducer with metallopeptidase domain